MRRYFAEEERLLEEEIIGAHQGELFTGPSGGIGLLLVIVLVLLLLGVI